MKYTVIGLGIALISSTIANKALAYDFHLSSEETIKYSQEFSPKLKATSDWQTFSYSLVNPIDVNDGDIFLYWSGQFKTNASTEGDKYYVGLQYDNNQPVLYVGDHLIMM